MRPIGSRTRAPEASALASSPCPLYRGTVDRRARARSVALAAGVLLVALVGCAVSPQPAVTRLPPGMGDAGTQPTATVPSPSVVPASPSSASTRPVSSAPPSSNDTVNGGADGGPVTCAEGESGSISGSEQTVRVEGACAQLTVSGSALTIDAGAARIGSLVIAGDRVRVDAAEITTLSVQGNDGSISAAGSIGSVDLSGDRTRVIAGGAISSVAVRGQNNTVSAGGGVGERVVEGRDNQVG